MVHVSQKHYKAHVINSLLASQNKDDGGWANDVDNEELSSDGKSGQSCKLNTAPNQIRAPKPLCRPMSSFSSGRNSKASKSKTSRTHRENQRLALEIEHMRTALSKSVGKKKKKDNALPHSQASLQNSDSSHSSSTRSNGSSIRRENERLRLENERIRLELKELQQNFAILQTTFAAPTVPEVIEVEVLRPDREEYLKSRNASLTNLVQRLAIECQDLQVENRMLRLQMTGDESERSHAGAAIVKPSLWEKYCNNFFMGGAGVLVVAIGAVTYSYYWPVSCAGRIVRIAKVIFQNGVVTDCIMEMVSKKTPEQKSETCPIEELIVDILRVSQGGIGLAELGW